MSQRCTDSHKGRPARKPEIEPAITAIDAFTARLIEIWTLPNARDWTRTLPWSGVMNCGSSDRYITAILGFARLVMKPIVKSFFGVSTGRSRTATASGRRALPLARQGRAGTEHRQNEGCHRRTALQI